MTPPDDPNTPENTGPNTGNEAPTGADDPTVPDAPSSGFRETQPKTPSSRVAVTPPLPDVLDKYRLLGEIGRGGMGSVYAAVRVDDAFKKRVAIKVMRAGLDTEDMLTRFELERQVLAAINHPNIARVFDAGATPDGRPYIVMELVEGKPIDRYSDDNNLSVVDRLALFGKVCAAVHHAHQNLVVHRDIKPANILVAADGEPKLLDFGIAKLLNPELSAIDPMTRADQRLLTYEYASPEQVTGEPITTASDVYALGVLLYELLTGHRPYELTRRVHEEAIRVICSTEPQRPSTAVSRSITVRGPGESARTITGEEIARRREMQLGRLRKRLSGDLDNIVLKAMRKTPGRRYPSADDLAADIQRHLTGQTVTARPPTWDYRAGKFIRRHRTAVTAAAFVAVSLIAGVSATTWQWLTAESQRARAENRTEQLRAVAGAFEDIADDIVRLEGATAARTVIADALVRTLDGLDARGDDDLLLDLAAAYRRAGAIDGGEGGRVAESIGHLRAAEALLADAGADDATALERARVDLELARALERAGDPDESARRAQAAADTFAALAEAEDDPNAATEAVGLAVEALSFLSWSRAARGEADTAAADRALELALDARDRDPTGARARRTLAIAYETLGRVRVDKLALESAIDAYTQAIELRRGLLDADPTDAENHRRLQVLHERQARTLSGLRRFDEAGVEIERARDLAERRVADDPFSGRAFEDLTRVYEAAGDNRYRAGDREAALPFFRAFLERAEAAADRDPLSRQRQRMVVLAHRKTGDTLRQLRRRDEAVDAYRAALARLIPLVGADPQNTVYRLDELIITTYAGRELSRLGRPAEAARLWSRGLEAGAALQRADPDWHEGQRALTALCARGLATIALNDADPSRAAELFERAQRLSPSVSIATLELEARAHRELGDADAERDRLHAIIDTATGTESPSEADLAARDRAAARLDELTGSATPRSDQSVSPGSRRPPPPRERP